VVAAATVVVIAADDRAATGAVAVADDRVATAKVADTSNPL
jgi:hypothetical protein